MARVSPAHHNQRHKKYPGGVFLFNQIHRACGYVYRGADCLEGLIYSNRGSA